MGPKRVIETTVVPDLDHAQWTNDQIICPKCNTKQAARILEEKTGPVYRHKCIKCMHIIRQKDWKSIQ